MSNKDEARRAKDLAETSMKKSDYATARRIALRAQKLDGNLENIGQMIMVCDVHCAAMEKSGDEIDWYKILQVEQNADDNTIKKQYRRLALNLHPDKNKLPGSESAFKTIGEAQRILLDKDKRRIHDMRRKPFKRPAPASQPQQAPPTTSFYAQPVFQKNFTAARNTFTTGLRPENQQKPQAPPTDSRSFWTSCAFCHKKYEYQREFINTLMTCPSCHKQYVAFEIGPPVQPTFSFFQQSKVPTQEAGKAAEKEKQKQPETSARMSSKKESYKEKRPAAAAENGNGKRKRKKVVESSECEEVTAGGQDSGSTGGHHSRRSVRSKHHVSYKETDILDNNEEEDAESAEQSDSRKQSREKHLFAETLPNGMKRTEKMKKDQAGSSRNATKDSSSESEPDLEIFECADPDFTNFEKPREESCFKAGQTWAMYDEMDQLPRYYAFIRKVIRKPGFMLEITWLEAEPDDEKAQQWVRNKLPVSVGMFKLGDNEKTKETPSFSHLIHCRKGSKKGTFSVYPRRGEVWALFKNWDINWSSSRQRSSRDHKYEYEFVEILSEYAEGAAIVVAFLRKVKGFASVFSRIGPSNTLLIPPHELLRFSHSIPSTKLTGKEGKDVPADSYELDTAALPLKIEEEEAVPVPVTGEAAKATQVNHRPPPSLEPDCRVIPNFQFHDFCAERLEGKFVVGQIWSLNSKEDGLPKCYAQIQQIVWRPVFVMQIKRLELQSLPANVKQWHDKNMPVSCGNFRVKEGPGEALTEVTGFSHAHQHDSRKNEYTILPKTGEIWAIYKNWSETIKVSSLKKCEYEAVEVLDVNESHIEVMVLERVQGFVSVFKEKMEGGIDVKKKIRRCELLSFSHYVPAFRLTGERDGTLRGCVVLDPTALSRNLRRS